MKLRSNTAKVTDAHLAYDELRKNWLMPNDCHCTVVTDGVTIYGDAVLDDAGVPLVYRIPNAAPPFYMLYPGHDSLVESSLSMLLADIGPWITEPFTVELYDGEIVHHRWHIRPGKCNVLQAALAPAGVRMMFWAATGTPKYTTLGNKKGRATGFAVRVNKSRAVQISHTFNGADVFNLQMSPEDSLKLGLALVHAAAGRVDKKALNAEVEEQRFLLSERVVPCGNDVTKQEGLSDA
jgi:hypothetical protein